METRGRNQKLSNSTYSDDESSIDSNYESLLDSKYMDLDTDDEYSPNNVKLRKNTGKRMQTFGDKNGCLSKKLRNNSSSMDDSRKPSIEKMPTRRPNPAVFNRNALMARENRRRKKEHMEELEKNFKDVVNENKKLRKILKQRNVTVKKLRNEEMYLKSIIANKSGIMSLLKSIQGNKMPITSSIASFVTTPTVNNPPMNTQNAMNSSVSYSCCSEPSPQSLGYPTPNREEGDKDTDGTVALANIDQLLPQFDSDFLFTDLFDFPCSSTSSGSIRDDELEFENWEKLLNDDTPFRTEGNILNALSADHNYSSGSITSESKDNYTTYDAGICLHLSSGRISLEFCAQCHEKSQMAWIEE